MTRSSGGSRQPNRPYRDDEARRDASDELDYEENGNNNGAARSRPARRSSATSHSAAADSAASEVTVDTRRRGIALISDVILIFALSMVVSPVLIVINRLLPMQFITQQLIMMLMLLARDYPYQGRGIGKNLMGLQVVDYTTGLPPTLIQSFKRNILFFVPLLLLGVVSLLKYLPIDKTIPNVIHQMVGFACNAYVILLLPAECWFALRGAGGRRIGDKLANTHIVPSSMDFSKFN